MKKVCIFNAPPRAGKDIAVRHCLGVFDQVNHLSFKTPLLEETFKLFGLTPDQIEAWDLLYDMSDGSGWVKDLILGWLVLDGVRYSMRGALIHTSENVIKPTKGSDYFGLCVAESLSEGLNLFSDGGFKEELQPLFDEVGVGNVFVIRVHRAGHDFSNDSRDYLMDLPCVSVDIYNPMGQDNSEEDYCSYLKLVVETVEMLVNE